MFEGKQGRTRFSLSRCTTLKIGIVCIKKARGIRAAGQWFSGWECRLNLVKQAFGFGLLFRVTFRQDFLETATRAFGVTHIDKGASQIELG